MSTPTTKKASKDGLAQELKQLPTPELAERFAEAKAIVAENEKVQKAGRTELIERLDDAQFAVDTATSETDDKVFVNTSGQPVIVVKTRRTAKLNEEKMRAYLDSKNVLEACLIETTTVTDPDLLADKFLKVQERLTQLGDAAMAQELEDVMAKATTVTNGLCESAIETMLAKGKLRKEDVAACYDVTFTPTFY